MTVAITPVTKPRMSEIRVPTTTCRKTSCPVCVVPSQWVADGGERISMLKALGSLVSMMGPKIATSTKNVIMPRPKATLRFIVTMRQISRRRCTCEENALISGEGGKLTSCVGILTAVPFWKPCLFRAGRKESARRRYSVCLHVLNLCAILLVLRHSLEAGSNGLHLNSNIWVSTTNGLVV